mgnify:CR=1 FL=1
MRFGFAASAAFVLVIGSGPVVAANIDAINNGWYVPFTGSQIDNYNTYTGWGADFEYRSFYAFDISSVTQAASAISITFYGDNLHFGYLGIYQGQPVTEHVSLFDYSGSVESLINRTGGAAAFNDLGTGHLLGEATLSGPGRSLMPQFTVALSSAFVSQFNLALGSQNKTIALGAALDGYTGSDKAIWVASGQAYHPCHPAAFLTVTPSSVPEPSTWALMLFGFGMVGATMRRRYRVTRIAFN